MATDPPELAVVLLTGEGCTGESWGVFLKEEGEEEEGGRADAQRCSARCESHEKVSKSTLESHSLHSQSDDRSEMLRTDYILFFLF